MARGDALIPLHAVLCIAMVASGPAGFVSPQAASPSQAESVAPEKSAEFELEALARQTLEAKVALQDAEKAAMAAPGAPKELQAKAPRVVPEPDRSAEPALPIGELEGQLNLAQGLAQAARDAATTLQAKAKERADRLTKIPREIEALGVALEDAKVELAALPEDADSAQRRALLEATIERDGVQIEALEAERSQYKAEAVLLQLQQDRAQARASAAVRAAELWSTWFKEERLALGDDAAFEAEKRLNELVKRFPVLQEATEPEREHRAMLVGENGLVSQIAIAQVEVDRLTQ